MTPQVERTPVQTFNLSSVETLSFRDNRGDSTLSESVDQYYGTRCNFPQLETAAVIMMHSSRDGPPIIINIAPEPESDAAFITAPNQRRPSGSGTPDTARSHVQRKKSVVTAL